MYFILQNLLDNSNQKSNLYLFKWDFNIKIKLWYIKKIKKNLFLSNLKE
jgi:hypothetical protein